MTATTDAPSRAFLIIREVLATPTTATADTIGDKTAARIEQRLKAAGLLVDAPTAAGVAPQEPSEELQIEEDYSHIYWRDPLEGCWVAYRRADCVGEEELPPTTLAAQPVLDPEKVAEWLGTEMPRKSRDETYGQYDRRCARALCEAAKRGELSA